VEGARDAVSSERARQSRSHRQAVLSPRRSRATPRRRRESSESFATSESDCSGSPLRGAAAGSSAPSGTLVGLGVGGGLRPDDPVVNSLTGSELALKVIPAINALKALLTTTVAALPVLEAAVVELKAGQLELARKVGDLTSKLTETHASVKLLDNWTIAAEFAQIPRGAVGSSGQVFKSLSSAPPQGVGSEVMSATVPPVLASTPVTSSLPELLASDIDSLFE